MPWDPDRYLRFADQRERPGIELLARVPDVAPSTIVDLGCGTGNLTALLAERWPDADVTGLDSSPEMIHRARVDHPDVTFTLADIERWEPDGRVDLVFSNATLHWIDGHARLFPKLRSHVAPGGVLAVQMPDNWREPTHRIPKEILDRSDWPEVAARSLISDRVSDVADYARWLAPSTLDIWRTTYQQRLAGDDPVWTWVTGSLLRPVLAALDGFEGERFATEVKAAYREAYPPGPDGVTTLPFSRLFIIASVPV